jgi:hypothetical protein
MQRKQNWAQQNQSRPEGNPSGAQQKSPLTWILVYEFLPFNGVAAKGSSACESGSFRPKNICGSLIFASELCAPGGYFLSAVSGRASNIGSTATATTAIMAPGTIVEPVR